MNVKPFITPSIQKTEGFASSSKKWVMTRTRSLESPTFKCQMMTFVPFDDLFACARALDYRRLGKQRCEAYQIWLALTGRGKFLPDGTEGPPKKGWVNHPATLMWKGHVCFLAMYCNAMIDEWVARGYRNNMAKLPHCGKPAAPWWWGWEPMHKSHQAALNRKKSDYYHFEVGDYANYGYVWPSKVDFSFRKIPEPILEKICEPVPK